MSTSETTGTIAQTEQEVGRLRESAALWPLEAWSWIEVVGDDRKGWLQGQQTNDLRTLDAGGSLKMCFCSPTGQLQADGTLWDCGDRYVLAVPRGGADEVLRRFDEMVFLEDVSARLMDAPAALTIQGPRASSDLGELLELPLLDSGAASIAGAPCRCFRSDRSGWGGWDLVFESLAEAAIRELEARFSALSPAAVEAVRIGAGIPKLGVDTDGRTLPPELGPAYEEAHISYAKGCYTGQEVLMRLHSRGHTNRTWMGLLCDEPVERGALVRSERREDAGKVTSAMGPLAASMVRNEAAIEGEAVEVESSAGRVRAELRHMPLVAR